jgi:hypothetical protein
MRSSSRMSGLDDVSHHTFSPAFALRMVVVEFEARFRHTVQNEIMTVVCFIRAALRGESTG